MNNLEIRSIIHSLVGRDYYDEMDSRKVLENVQGWGSTDPIFGKLISEHRPQVIIELGSWKGGSAITMAEECHKNDLDSVIICVDTWLGSKEHVESNWDDLKSLFAQFLSNVMWRGLQSRIIPFPSLTTTASYAFKAHGIMADMIYIDAAHDEQSVLKDLLAYCPLLNKGAVLFGHDIHCDQVRSAVEKFCDKIGGSYTIHDFHWVYHA